MDIYTAQQVYNEIFIGHPLQIEAKFESDKWFMTRRQQSYWIEQMQAYRSIWEDKHTYWNVFYGSLQS